MRGKRGTGKGKDKGEGSSSGGTTARNMAGAVLPTDVVVPTGQSVPPPPALPAAPPDAGALEASITLASLSMPAHAAGVLVTTQGEPLAGSTETSATIAMVAGSTAAAAQDVDVERLRKQAEKKRKQWWDWSLKETPRATQTSKFICSRIKKRREPRVTVV